MEASSKKKTVTPSTGVFPKKNTAASPKGGLAKKTRRYSEGLSAKTKTTWIDRLQGVLKISSREAVRATPLVTVAPEEVADIKNGLRLQIIDDTTGEPIAALVSVEDYVFLEEVDAKLDAQDVAELTAIREESAKKGAISLNDFLQTLDD